MFKKLIAMLRGNSSNNPPENSPAKSTGKSSGSPASRLVEGVGITTPNCPHCEAELDKFPGRKKKCPGCGEFIFVRTRPTDSKRILVTEEEAELVEEYWAIKNGTHSAFLADKAEREAVSKKLGGGGEPASKAAVDLSMCQKELKTHAGKHDWGLYRNAQFGVSEAHGKLGNDLEALKTALLVSYIDCNGPNNCGDFSDDPDEMADDPPFNLDMAILAPGQISQVAKFAKKLSLDEGQVETLFMEVARDFSIMPKLPQSPEGAWALVRTELY
jgi:DNA-directed RNA polymerase subunit RPC12/RpoP